jgi:four helix bundle protein
MNSSDHTNGGIRQGNSSGEAHAAMFDHEKLDVYQLELQFITWVTLLMEQSSRTPGAKAREVCDQLDRASLSALLNTAEGNGKRQRQVRAKFFDDARGSATECAGCLDALVAKNIAPGDRIVEGKRLLVRIVSMLCRLVERFDAGSALHEESGTYVIGNSADRDDYSLSALTTRTRTRTRTRMRKEKKL